MASGPKEVAVVKVVRLAAGDVTLAQTTVALMGEVFAEEPWLPVPDGYLAGLLADGRMWLYAAVDHGDVVGGLTAHQLPMTRAESTELLLYDIAVRTDRQRRGVGRALLDRLRTDGAAAGFGEVWVPVDGEDDDALEFYRRTGGAAQAVTIYTYPAPGTSP
jgi:aminoglycoside 3-N-acetyltransferase I